MNIGDIVYFCKDGQCIEVIFRGRSDIGCRVEVDGSQFIVECEYLQEECAALNQDDLETQTKATFSINQRVLVRMTDEATASVRMWPATVKAIHENGRLSLTLDGLRGRITSEAEHIAPLETANNLNL